MLVHSGPRRGPPAVVLTVVLAGCVHSESPRTFASSPRGHAVVADLHQHLTMGSTLWLSRGGTDAPLAEDPHDRRGNQLSVPALRAAGVRVVVATIWPPPGRPELEEVERQVQRLEDFAAAHPGLAVVRSAAEARRALSSHRIALFPGVEGAASITRVEDVDRLHAAGVRVVGLVHFFDNAVADAADNQFGPLGRLTNGAPFGLSELGRAAVRRMVELGMVVDVEHASPRAVRDVLDVLEPLRAPAIASHVGATFDRPHSLEDESAVRLARLGGLIGVGVYREDRLVPTPGEERFEGFQAGTCDEVVARWLHFARLVGATRVVLGSDFNSLIDRAGPGGGCPRGLRSAADLPALFEALVARGVPRESLDDSGLRLLELVERLEAGASR